MTKTKLNRVPRIVAKLLKHARVMEKIGNKKLSKKFYDHADIVKEMRDSLPSGCDGCAYHHWGTGMRCAKCNQDTTRTNLYTKKFD